MQQFTTRGVRHEFDIDGATYWLDGATIADYGWLARFSEIPDEDKFEAFRDFVLARVRPRGWWSFVTGRSARRAVLRLTPRQLNELVDEWVAPGMSSGESSGSPKKSSRTGQS